MGNMQFNRQTIINSIANKSIVWVSGQDSTAVPAGQLSRVAIYSPKGTISRLFNAKLLWSAESGTPSGFRQFIVDVQTQAGVGTGGIGMFKLQCSNGGGILWDQGYFGQGDGMFPNDLNALAGQIHNTMFDDGRAVQMVNYNGLNVAATAQRTWDLFVEREVVSR